MFLTDNTSFKFWRNHSSPAPVVLTPFILIVSVDFFFPYLKGAALTKHAQDPGKPGVSAALACAPGGVEGPFPEQQNHLCILSPFDLPNLGDLAEEMLCLC